jgi:hypothetical protein
MSKNERVIAYRILLMRRTCAPPPPKNKGGTVNSMMMGWIYAVLVMPIFQKRRQFSTELWELEKSLTNLRGISEMLHYMVVVSLNTLTANKIYHYSHYV